MAESPPWRPFGGGTTILPAIHDQPIVRDGGAARWMSVAGIPEVAAAICVDDDVLAFGAATRLRDLEFDPLVRLHAPILATAVRLVAGPAIRNAASIGGSLGSGGMSPDPATALTALGSRLVILREGQSVELSIEKLRYDDLIVEVRIPLARTVTGSAYRRFTTRGGADRPIVTVAVSRYQDQTRIAVGAAFSTARRMVGTERAIAAGHDPQAAIEAELRSVRVINDDRASASYRRRVIAVLVTRALDAAGRRDG